MSLSRATARAKWGFPREGGHVLLVYGGSQGSQAINRAVAGWLDLGLPDDLYLIWMTGTATFDEFASFESERVRVRDYLVADRRCVRGHGSRGGPRRLDDHQRTVRMEDSGDPRAAARRRRPSTRRRTPRRSNAPAPPSICRSSSSPVPDCTS